ncbi:XdhC family protein [Streptomyces sp. B21-104]|uniref:XdhC family protein n=1 Tax=Streptomyces sp. B21-104 TaxID=3039421 RepID=UPI0030D2E3B1
MQINGSAPLPLGTALALDADGNAVGSVFGVCVEGAVYDSAGRYSSRAIPRPRHGSASPTTTPWLWA